MKQEIKPINKRLSIYRRLAGYTQQTAAEALGMKKNTYARMELHGNPTYDMIIRLASLYKVSANLILYGTEEVEPKPITPGPTDGKTIFVGNPEEPDHTLKEEPHIFKPQPELVLNTNETNLIKVFRTFSKDEQNEVMAFLNKLYHKRKGNG